VDELIQQITETARAMWRRRWVGVAVAWIAAIAGAVGLTLIKDRFEANARVYVDTKTVLRPLLRDLTVEPDLDQTVGLLARTLITRPNVEVLMHKSGLDKPDTPPAERDVMVEALLRDIKITGIGHDNVFTFTYRDTSRERAQLVVQNLVSLFLESDTGTKRRDAVAARDFIDEQIKSYEARLAEAEDRLKDFKLRNLGVTDASGKDYFTRISALTDELGRLNLELRAAEQSRDALKRELGGEKITLVPETPQAASGTPVTEYDARLEAQHKQLDELLRRYTEQHPDVVAARHLIARLEEDRKRELERLRNEAESRPPPSPSSGNSVQQQIRLALAEAEAQVASLRVRAGDTQAKLAQMRASASRVPEIEAEMARLNRDYEVIRSTYQTMVSRREKAVLSEDVDATRSAQFRVIDPPRAAPGPVFPNRLALAPLVLLLSLVAGLVATFVAVQLMPTIDNARMLRVTTQRPVLGTISMVMNDTLLTRARHRLLRFASAIAALAIAAGGWIAWVSIQTHA